MKVCCRCKAEKEEKDFSIKRSTPDGLNRSCRECHNRYTRDHYKRNKKKYISKAARHASKLKEEIRSMKEVPCMDCGVSYPYYVMDFDHVRGKKEFQLSQVRFTGRLKALEEAAKCDVVCANCHRIRTHQRKLTV